MEDAGCSSEVIRATTFRERIRGYDTDAVDVLLDRAAAAMDDMSSRVTEVTLQSWQTRAALVSLQAEHARVEAELRTTRAQLDTARALAQATAAPVPSDDTGGGVPEPDPNEEAGKGAKHEAATTGWTWPMSIHNRAARERAARERAERGRAERDQPASSGASDRPRRPVTRAVKAVTPASEQPLEDGSAPAPDPALAPDPDPMPAATPDPEPEDPGTTTGDDQRVFGVSPAPTGPAAAEAAVDLDPDPPRRLLFTFRQETRDWTDLRGMGERVGAGKRRRRG